VNQLRNPSDGAVVFIHRETLHGEVLFCDPHTS
jgi:hypothetical protein